MTPYQKALLPPIAILFITAFITYFPNMKMGLIVYLFLVSFAYGSSIFTFYYFFSQKFPDKRNTEIPPQFLKKEQVELSGVKGTKAFKLTVNFSLLTIIIGLYVCCYLPSKYKENELNQNGVKTKGIVTYEMYSKTNMGQIRGYKFMDKTNVEHSDKIKNETLKEGDTIEILYSSKRPDINKVLSVNEKFGIN